MPNEIEFSKENNEYTGEGLLGAASERMCRRTQTNSNGNGACSVCIDCQGELAPIIVVSTYPLKVVSGIGLKIVAVPTQQILEQWQEKVLRLQVSQQLRRCMPRRA